MKICISSNGNSSDSMMDPRFGRTAYFIIADTDTMEFRALENAAAASGGGAGVTAGQLMINNEIAAVITGNVGPNAMSVLKAGNVKIYRGEPATVKENVNKFKEGALERIDTTVASHYGMGLGGGRNR